MPTNYTGAFALSLYADQRQGRYLNNERKEVKSTISTEQSHGGTHSLRIIGGGFHDIFYGCDAGNKTVFVWVYAPVVGKCGLQIFDAADVLGEAFNVGAGAWEQISAMFWATKKVYVVRLINAAYCDGDTRAYFDDLT